VSAPDEASPHHISLAIWDLASPVVAGRRTVLKVGVSCSCGCDVSATCIELRDVTQTKIGSGVLGPEPWPGTRALYWTEVNVPAPDTAGEHAWSVHATPPNVAPPNASLPNTTQSYLNTTQSYVVSGFSRTLSGRTNITHDPATSTIRIVVVAAPQHRVTLAVTEKKSGAPAAGVELRLGPFRGTTDERGIAYIDVPSGSYETVAWKVGFDLLTCTAHVSADTRLSLELVATLQPEQPYWM
jgi:hypothetical protein